MFLSIVIPIYNVEKYLPECLDSLVKQNIPKSDYEIICVDDGSTDNSGAILDRYAEKYDNIVVIHKENGGVSSARNAGIDIAKGDYIWFIDSDDLIQENTLSSIREACKTNEYDTVAIKLFAFKDGEDINEIKRTVTTDDCQDYYRNMHPTRIKRLSIIKQNNIRFEEKISLAEDGVFHIIYYAYAKTEFFLENPVIYLYRLRNNSLTGAPQEKRLVSRIAIIEALYKIKSNALINQGDINGLLYPSTAYILSCCAEVSRKEAYETIRRLKRLDAYPLKYKKEFSPKSKRKNEGFYKRIYHSLYDICYTRTGYHLLRCWIKISRPIKKLKRLK